MPTPSRTDVLPVTRRLAAAVVILSAVAASCGPEPAPRTAARGTDPARDHASMSMEAPPPAGPATEASLYVLDQLWTDQGGRPVHLGDLAGRPRVIAMVYTHCTWACPRILAEMKRLEAAVADVPAERAPGFVLVSIDPTRDTPEHLAAFARATRLDPARWTLLTGPDDQVRELSVLLGVKYRATDAGEFSHSNLVTVLDGHGVVAARLEGLDGDVEPAIRVLRHLTEVGTE